MNIPKKIHYCWFGGNPLPASAKKCIASWEKYCPDCEIIEWNETNFDVNCNAYCSTMARQHKWAFLSDYARLKIVYEQGGIYLDTDVQLIRSLEELTSLGAYMGVETNNNVATGLGFAADAGNPLLRENMAYYEALEDFSTLRACPWITTEVLARHGYDPNNCNLPCQIDGLNILPADYLCPKDERSGLTTVTKNTYSIHHFDASWFEPSWKENQKKRWRQAKLDHIIHTPNRLLRVFLGDSKYSALKQKWKHLKKER